MRWNIVLRWDALYYILLEGVFRSQHTSVYKGSTLPCAATLMNYRFAAMALWSSRGGVSRPRPSTSGVRVGVSPWD